MLKRFLSIALLSAGAFVVASTVNAAGDTAEPVEARPIPFLGQWGFAGRPAPESAPALRHRLVRLLYMADAHALVQSCDSIEISQVGISRMFEATGLGPVTPEELTFAAGNIAHFKERNKAALGEETCEWAYENYGPNGARYGGLIRMKEPMREPEATSSVETQSTQ